MDVCCECCVLSGRGLCVGVLPTVAGRCVWSIKHVSEERLVYCGLSRQKQTNKQTNKHSYMISVDKLPSSGYQYKTSK